MHRRWLRIGGLIAGSLLLVWLASRAVSSWRSEAALRAARRDVAAGRFLQARRRLTGRAGSGSASPEAAYLLGLCEHAAGDPGAALAAWSRVPEGSPFADRAALARAQTLVDSFGRFADAEPLLRKVMRGRGPTAVEARHALFQLCFWEGRTVEMRRLIEEAWDRLPDRAAELLDHWRIDSVPVDRDLLRTTIEAAARRAPDDDRVWLAHAYLATLANRLDEADRRLIACQRARPDDPAVWWARLRWARQADRPDEARRALEHLPADHAEPAEVLDLRAWFAAQAGDRVAERRALERLAEIEPGNSRALGRLIALTPPDGPADHLADLRRRKIAADQAKEQYLRLIESEASPPDHVELARLAESLGRWFEARGWWTLAVVHAPSNPDVRASLARIRSRPVPPRPPAGQTLAQRVDDASSDPSGE